MADISKFPSAGQSRVNTAQAILEARARKKNQNEIGENPSFAAEISSDVNQTAKSSDPAYKGYLDQEEVSFRARVSNMEESPENIRSLIRLKRTFDSGQPLRGDVPRGYYLNLRV